MGEMGSERDLTCCLCERWLDASKAFALGIHPVGDRVIGLLLPQKVFRLLLDERIVPGCGWV